MPKPAAGRTQLVRRLGLPASRILPFDMKALGGACYESESGARAPGGAAQGCRRAPFFSRARRGSFSFDVRCSSRWNGTQP